MPPEAIPYIGMGLSVICLAFALRIKKHQRLMRDLPTSKTSGVFIGFNELKGLAKSSNPLSSFLAEADCVYYDYQVSEKWSRWETETYTDSKGNRRTRRVHKSGWTTVASGGNLIPFILQDDYGVVRIQPEGAKIEPLTMFSKRCGMLNPLYYGKGPNYSIMDSDHIRQFTEYGIPIDDELYILGQARERSDTVAAEIAQSKSAPLFLISTREEDRIIAGKAWKFSFLIFIGFMLAFAPWIWLDQTEGKQPNFLLYGICAVSYFTAALFGFIIMIYNSLIGLKNRVHQADSLIEIQLKRRYELIPNLVECVQELKEYTEETLTKIAALRGAQQHGLSNSQEALFTPAAPQIMLLKEAYPELNTHEHFKFLQQSLTDTEDRIELARRYYCEIASQWNARRKSVPDVFLAKLIAPFEAKLFEIAAAEAAVPKIDFTA